MGLKNEKTVELEEARVYTCEQVASIMQLSAKIVRSMCRSGRIESCMTPAGYRIAGFSLRKMLDGSMAANGENNNNV